MVAGAGEILTVESVEQMTRIVSPDESEVF
jgi:hypothetical protein